jgi:hypothetical protein
LVAEEQPNRARLAQRIRFDVPHQARIWNYWLGGAEHYPADRAVGDAVLKFYPGIADLAVESRRFSARVIRCLAGELGVRQFLDVGTGLPATPNLHEMAQRAAPTSKFVYVDNDPVVLAYARAWLVNGTGPGTVDHLDADYREPERLLAAARELLDFGEPVAVLFMGVLGYLRTFSEMRSVLGQVRDGLPAGSYLGFWDATDTSPSVRAGVKAQTELGAPYALRTLDQLEQCLAGLEPVAPGLTRITEWRPTDDPRPSEHAEPVDGYGALARKP